jgi:TolB-like protein/class 3 adenylate cyclase/Tfp pilus assembly protein PilF
MVKDSRKIAAILAADVVEYSRLMGVDEQGTLAALKIRRAIFDRLVKESGGQEFGSVGDSLMAQFPSAINAVRCAQNLQHAIAEANDSLPPDRRMALRIGVNLGDVIKEKGALFGDGVNIAARLQGLAKPGGVLVSGAVYEQVKNKLSASFTFIGARHLKNVSEPVACYEVTEPVVASFAHRVAAQFGRRHRPWLAPAITGVAAILAMASWQWWGTADKDRNPASGQDEKSIAVLPFLDLSAGKDQEYFSDGISEELLNLLAKIPQLRVISRSSAFSFKGQDLEMPEIGKRLNVAHILEGSVRKSGNQVRITAQLIDTHSDTHLWSETYDRPLDDIFAVQDEIAGAVVAQLKLKLLGAVPKAKATDPKAYALYLQARQLNEQITREGYQQSIALYQQVLTIDPNYAAAWNGLADSYRQQAEEGLRPSDEAYRLARETADKALAIDPDYAPAHATLGLIAYTYDGDLGAAARHLEHALALEPTSTDIISSAASLALSLGRLDTAIALYEYILARNPVNVGSHHNQGYAYFCAGRLDEAIASLRTALSMAPDADGFQVHLGEALLLKGDHTEALAAMQKESAEAWRMIGLPMAYHALGRKAESDAALAELIRKYEKAWAYNIAEVLAYRGEVNRAFEWLDKAIAYHDPGVSEVNTDPLLANLHKDPRWLPFLRKLGRAPEQLAVIKFDVKLPK